jgi:glutamate N-acetyltransferase/amino-acid N-acetyltransferase
MTTDSFNKEVSFKVILEDGRTYSIGAIAKGAGMINPAMATMLCFITTDAKLTKEEIDGLLKEVNEITFDAISVDGDTSTNDTVILIANGKSGVSDITSFREVLKLVMQQMALDMVRDGEGAKKAVAFEINGAKTYEDAVKAAKALSNSLLVKTMLFGEDPNWGRIACIIGASGAYCEETKLKISFDNILVYDSGSILMTKDVEELAHKVMQKSEFKIKSDLGVGSFSYTAFGCDLGYKYVEINADYRT